MGDRTFTEIHINIHYYQQHKDSLDKLDYERADTDEEAVFIDYEANYAQMHDLEDYCRDHLIEYDKYHEAGGDYDAGEEYARVIDGQCMVHDLSKSGVDMLNQLKVFLKHQDQPVKMIAEMKKLVKQLEPFEITPLKAPQSIDFIKND